MKQSLLFLLSCLVFAHTYTNTNGAYLLASNIIDQHFLDFLCMKPSGSRRREAEALEPSTLHT